MTRQDRAPSLAAEVGEEILNAQIREEILQQLVGKQVLGIGLERLMADVSRAVSDETSKLDAGWCKGKCSFGDFADLIRRCIYAFNTACNKVLDGKLLSACVSYWILESFVILAVLVVGKSRKHLCIRKLTILLIRFITTELPS